MSSFAEAIRTAGLADRLNSLPAATVFAPTNEAFIQYRAATGQRGALTQASERQQLTDLVNGHLTDLRVDGHDLVAGTRELTTLDRGTLRAALDNRTLTVTKSTNTAGGRGAVADVVCGNIPTSNATLFIIDKVLPANRP